MHIELICDSYGDRCAGESPELKSGWYSYPAKSWRVWLKKPWDKYTLTFKWKYTGKVYDTDGEKSYPWSTPGRCREGKHTLEWEDFILNVEVYGKTLDDIIAATQPLSK